MADRAYRPVQLKFNDDDGLVDIYSDDLLWITFKGQGIRIEQDEEYNDGMLMITVHIDDESYHAKLLVKPRKT